VHHEASGSDTVLIDILHPAITIDKWSASTKVMENDWVTYWINVSNPSTDTEMWFDVYDVKIALKLGLNPANPLFSGYLAPYDVTKKTWYDNESFTVQLKAVDGPVFHNEASVLAKDHQWDDVRAEDKKHHEAEDKDTWDVNVYLYAKVYGFVFEDFSLDGYFQQAVELGLPRPSMVNNWTVHLYGTDIFGVYHDDAYYDPRQPTEDTGNYIGWDKVIPGDYTIKVVLDPLAVPYWATTNGTLKTFSIAGGESDQFDWGYIESQLITGYKWRDDNMNGVKDDGEPFLSGWTIKLDGYESFSRDPPAAPKHVTLTDTTDGDGQFSFRVFPGVYDVYEVLLDGTWVAIFPDSSGRYSDVTVVPGGDDIWCCKFGNVQNGSISGVKFRDDNLNKVRDGLEPYLDGWTIYLDGVQVDGVVVHRTNVTWNGGQWIFKGLLPGIYRVSEEDRYGWHATTATFYDRIVINSGTIVPPQKFGNVPTTTIWGYKFLDKDLDKQNDTGKEPGLAGWTIKLEKLVGSEWVLVYSTTTDAKGKYVFRDLFQQPGQYRVVEVLQTGWINTTRVIPFSVAGRPAIPTVVRNDIGNIRTSSVEGFKFEDQYGPNGELPNMVKDASEWGIGNWHITLEGRMVNGTYVFMEAWTRNDGCLPNEVGFYGFTMLLPGTYWLNESVVEQGWVPTTPSSLRITIPAYSAGPPFKMVINFGNTHPEDPELNFVLRKGTNLWSSPLQMGVSLKASDLASIVGPNCLSIKTYNNGKYYTYKPGVSGSAEDFEIRYGVGYYVVVKGFTTFRLSGDLVSSSQTTLVKGTNIIGFNELKPIMASQFVNQDPSAGPVYVNGATILSIKYLGSDGKYYTYKPGVSGPTQDFVLTQGRAYFLVLDGPGTIVYPTGG
jgi:hypothetical protein